MKSLKNFENQALPTQETQNIKGGYTSDELIALVNAKESEIQAQFNSGTDFEDTKNILLMQQMMNEWSFAVGLSSSLTKTISDTLKGIVQKI